MIHDLWVDCLMDSKVCFFHVLNFFSARGYLYMAIGWGYVLAMRMAYSSSAVWYTLDEKLITSLSCVRET